MAREVPRETREKDLVLDRKASCVSAHIRHHFNLPIQHFHTILLAVAARWRLRIRGAPSARIVHWYNYFLYLLLCRIRCCSVLYSKIRVFKWGMAISAWISALVALVMNQSELNRPQQATRSAAMDIGAL